MKKLTDLFTGFLKLIKPSMKKKYFDTIYVHVYVAMIILKHTLNT